MQMLTYQKELLEFPLDVFLPKCPSAVGTRITPKPSKIESPIYHLSRSIISAEALVRNKQLAPSFGIDAKDDRQTQIDSDTSA